MASRNLSVAQFQALMARIPKAIAGDLSKAVDEAADELVRIQQSAAPRGPTGNLRASIRKEQGRHPLSRLVKAGGPLTTKPVREGQKATYDYALGTEFGNREVGAQPFFWPSYRLSRKRLRSRISRKVKPAMKKVVKVE